MNLYDMAVVGFVIMFGIKLRDFIYNMFFDRSGGSGRDTHFTRNPRIMSKRAYYLEVLQHEKAD
jgi:hypothetical protein